MRTSDSIIEISKALVAARKEITAPLRSRRGTSASGDEYFYADLADDIAASESALLGHGIMVMQESITSSTHLITTTRLQHDSGEFFESEPLELDRTGISAHDTGTLITYSRRYQLEALLFMSAQHDPDAAEASRKQREQATSQAPADSPPVTTPPGDQSAGATPKAVKDPTKPQASAIQARILRLGWTKSRASGFVAKVTGHDGPPKTSPEASAVITALDAECKKAGV